MANHDFCFWNYFMLQSGCCKPPTVCGYNYVNPTLWLNPVNPAADPDCYLWNNDQSQLCYNCNACKAGLLGNLRREWRKTNVILIVAVVVLIWVYVIACSAFKNAQTEDLFRRYKQGWVWSCSHHTFQMLVLDLFFFVFFFFFFIHPVMRMYRCLFCIYSLVLYLSTMCGGMAVEHTLPMIGGSISIFQLSWESDSSIFTECFGTLRIE